MKKNFSSPEGRSIYFPPLCTHIVTSGQILGKSGVRYFAITAREMNWDGFPSERWGRNFCPTTLCVAHLEVSLIKESSV